MARWGMGAKTFTTAVLFSAFVACGGAVAQDLGDGGDPASDGGDPGTGDGGGSDSGRDAVAIDAGSGCDKLGANVDDLRPKALQCCYQCNVQQCDKLVEDLCCPISVSSGNFDKVGPFEDAVRAFKNAGCQVPCPASPCRTAPSKQCQMSGACIP